MGNLCIVVDGPVHIKTGLDAKHVNNKGAGLSSYSCSLISASVVHLLESIQSKLTGLSTAQPETPKQVFLAGSCHLFKQKDPVWNVVINL